MPPMSILAGAIKVSTLAVALTCIGAVKPMPDARPHRAASDATSPKLQCRIYFGCAPNVRVSTVVAQQQQEYVR